MPLIITLFLRDFIWKKIKASFQKLLRTEMSRILGAGYDAANLFQPTPEAGAVIVDREVRMEVFEAGQDSAKEIRRSFWVRFIDIFRKGGKVAEPVNLLLLRTYGNSGNTGYLQKLIRLWTSYSGNVMTISDPIFAELELGLVNSEMARSNRADGLWSVLAALGGIGWILDRIGVRITEGALGMILLAVVVLVIGYIAIKSFLSRNDPDAKDIAEIPYRSVFGDKIEKTTKRIELMLAFIPNLIQILPLLIPLLTHTYIFDGFLLYALVLPLLLYIASLAIIAIYGHSLIKRTVIEYFRDTATNTMTREKLTALLGAEPQKNGLYRTITMFCYEDVWKRTLEAMCEHADMVVMDLRDYSESKLGCRFEIQYIVDHFPLDKVLILVEEKTDLSIVQLHFAIAAKGMSELSPNFKTGTLTVHVTMTDISDDYIYQVHDYIHAVAKRVA